MSTIAAVVKAALALDQKVQAGISKVAHTFASRSFSDGEQEEVRALVRAEDTILKLERSRAKRAADLHAQYKASLVQLHEGVDAAIELAEGRKVQDLGKAKQLKQYAAMWQATSIHAQVAAENARKAAEQLS